MIFHHPFWGHRQLLIVLNLHPLKNLQLNFPQQLGSAHLISNWLCYMDNLLIIYKFKSTTLKNPNDLMAN